MAKRKNRPKRDRPVIRPALAPDRLYVSHCHFEQLPEVDLSAYEWGHITTEALAQIQVQFGQMKWLSLQAEQLGEALAECEAELARRGETIAHQEKELARLRKRLSKQRPQDEFEG